LTGLDGPFAARDGRQIRACRLIGGTEAPPAFADFLARVAGRTPVICELKSGFDRDWRLVDRLIPLAAAYEGPLAFKSFDPDMISYLRLRWPDLGPPDSPCPVGIVAEGSYDHPEWAFLTREQRRTMESFDHRDRSLPDFLSFNVDHLPHKIPFFEKQLHGLPVMTWTVRTPKQREAARKWADQIVFEGEAG
jgi:glycerophosphoryl diester phosphodiesterase